MAIEEGYSRYMCDRPEKAHKDGKKPHAFLQETDKAAAEWHKVEHIDDNGVTTPYLLCSDCYEKWLSMNKTWQRDFKEFINEGLY